MATYRAVEVSVEKDRQAVIDIWKRNLADLHRLEEKFDWHFVNNPFGKGRCWILMADGRPVGSTSLGMFPLKAGNSVVTSGAACDLAVDKEHRFLLPALTLQRALVTAPELAAHVVYGVPNPRGAAVMKRAGYQACFEVHRYAKVLRLSRYLERAGTTSFGAVTSRTIDALYQCASAFKEKRPGNFGVSEFEAFDARFDELWNALRDRHTTMTTRTSPFLRWRYTQCPLREYKTVGLLTPGHDRLLGYVIYYAEGECAMCEDVFGGADISETDALLAAWAAHARRAGLSYMSVSCAASPQIVASLKRMGFSRRTVSPNHRSHGAEPSREFLAYGNGGHLDLAQWYFMQGDLPYS